MDGSAGLHQCVGPSRASRLSSLFVPSTTLLRRRSILIRLPTALALHTAILFRWYANLLAAFCIRLGRIRTLIRWYPKLILWYANLLATFCIRLVWIRTLIRWHPKLIRLDSSLWGLSMNLLPASEGVLGVAARTARQVRGCVRGWAGDSRRFSVAMAPTKGRRELDASHLLRRDQQHPLPCRSRMRRGG